MKQWILLFFLFLTLGVNAQEKRLHKAEVQYENQQYQKALKSLEKVFKHKNTKNSPEAYLLHAKVMLALKDNPDYPKALSDALKSAEKALRKSKSPELIREQDTSFFRQLLDECMAAAYSDLQEQRYIQSDKYFSKVFDLYHYLPARWGNAEVALALKDTATAVHISREMVAELSAAQNPGKALSNPQPFVLLTQYKIENKQYDSAAYYAEMGLDIYPESALLKSQLLKSFLLLVTQSRPELSTLDMFAAMRPRFKDDSLYIHKETVLFLYLMNRFSAGDENHIADSLLAGFIHVKNEYYAEYGKQYQEMDPLYNSDNNELIFNLIRYSAKFERTYMLAMLLNNYVSGNYADSSFQASIRPDRWKNLFNRVKEEKSIFLLASSLNAASAELKKDAWFNRYKHQELLAALNHPENYTDRTALYNFIPFVLEEYPNDKEVYQKTQALSTHLIGEYTDSSWFSYARIAVKQHDQYFPQTVDLRKLKKNLVVKDFQANYFGSRLLKVERNGQQVFEYTWNGNDLLCDAGSIPGFVQDKVEQRINYFRRAAGVPDYVRLDTFKNAACQKAALIYQVNDGKLFTAPAETWKCYAQSAVEAAQLSARVFGQTTVFAVTTIMADQDEENTFVGNRRWLLYPPARYMGHGSTNKVALIWTLDDGGDKDSSDYMMDFVSWPPRDYCPAMFAFNRWNFSLYANLTKARVTMSVDGKTLPLKQEQPVDGYGMPTLVWTPQFKPEMGKSYVVKIEGILLHGDSHPHTYTYTVEFIDPMKSE
ncbi:MAG: hypothetical protein GC180_00555 [Bacteroidetes bacterium]|nr:hypothetical protein [Bacteroidota bacterium]